MHAKKANRIVVTRFSAMGDVALLLPALHSILANNSDTQIWLVTRPQFAPFFQGIPRLHIIHAELKTKHKGLAGLWRLFFEIRRIQPTHWVDAHDVIRSQFLRVLAFFYGLPVGKINKGRGEKKQWTRREKKIRIPLKPTVERYLEAFQRVGIPVHSLISKPSYFQFSKPTVSSEIHRIGIAPFAQHEGKRWPKYPEVIQQLIQQTNFQIWILGGGESEKNTVATWQFPEDRVVNSIGRFSLEEEIKLISTFDLVVANDSSNLHLAALSGIPTLSLWGATHPDVGFGPWPTEKAHIMQVPTEELACRPCSVFGNTPCFRGDYACLSMIQPSAVVEKIKALVNI